jgi:succinate-semialdehyde dehydrogenase/glutarate-semialdehyde dehydrogenase
MNLVTIDPSTGERLEAWVETSEEEVDLALGRAQRAFTEWAGRPLEERRVPVLRLASLLREEAEVLSLCMAREMGKPIAQGRAEIEKCARVCEHYAEHAGEYLSERKLPPIPETVTVAPRPLGPVYAIMPWNFPFWQVLRFVAPTLMAGNVAILKHAPGVPGCARAIVDLVRRAGFPDGVFESLRLGESRAEALIARPEIVAVTLTGSTTAGRAVAAAAGRAIKPCVLELGGSDAAVVLEDADLELAVEECVASRLINTGQSCIAAKRWIVAEEIAREFTERATAAMAARRWGNPILDREAELGPLARFDLRDHLADQVARSLRGGATLLCGGETPAGAGAFYPPTLLADVEPGSPAFEEELFGPVAAITLARDEAHAVALANATSFGLGASVFTRDSERGERIARDQLRAGSCFVNTLVRSDPGVPFGGIGASGHGRELGREGILAFMNLKAVVVRR